VPESTLDGGLDDRAEQLAALLSCNLSVVSLKHALCAFRIDKGWGLATFGHIQAAAYDRPNNLGVLRSPGLCESPMVDVTVDDWTHYNRG
jgi:hypothetical protein